NLNAKQMAPGFPCQAQKIRGPALLNRVELQACFREKARVAGTIPTRADHSFALGIGRSDADLGRVPGELAQRRIGVDDDEPLLRSRIDYDAVVEFAATRINAEREGHHVRIARYRERLRLAKKAYTLLRATTGLRQSYPGILKLLVHLLDRFRGLDP